MLNDIQAVILDMDGVLWRGDAPLSGVVPFFDFLREKAIPFVLATNNSTQTVASYVDKMAQVGVRAAPENVITSGVVTADYLRATYPDGLRVHVLGEAGLRQILRDAGYPSVDADADVVVVGMDRAVTYDKLRQATYLIRAGARFIGTNADRSFPTPEGLAPGAGSILAALEASTDQAPLVLGKPEVVMFEMALARLNAPAERTLMVGDRLETDILGAQRAGLRTALMLTGVTTPAMAASSDIKLDLIFDDLDALREAWAAARR